ncbi:hypothetical protein SAMN05216464_102441 [Mucilaginibacter pineti]|uniref:Uncharacterized protein n=1 Tax=Mucilaginibacter pineti TaxID=1391627 RepID=A0A1G6XB91_9SPHI|nr:hypothetical protein SAMN05216464_102441 [Mucilaginibacter pineti]
MGSQVIGSTNAGINKTNLALRKYKTKATRTPNIINAIKTLFNVVSLLVNSAKLNSDCFFIIQKLFSYKSGHKNILKDYTLV